MNVRTLRIGFILAVAFSSLAVTAQQSHSSAMIAAPNTYGTAAETSYTVQVFAFDSGSATIFTTLSGARGCVQGSPTCQFYAPVALPTGASITKIELDGCDNNVSSDIFFDLWRAGKSESSTTALAASQTVGSPGCVPLAAVLGTPHTVDNFNNSYFIHVGVQGSDNFFSPRFQAVRVFYRLQVSPPPQTATFSDVPTSHPFFQYIEAMSAAGITGGCAASPPTVLS